MPPSDAQDKIEEFNKWNKKKQAIEFSSTREILFKEGEIWWCSIGLNIRDEIFGKGPDFCRLVIVVKKLSRYSCIVLPLTSKPKYGDRFVDITVRGLKNWVMLHQIRMVNISRFDEKIVSLNDADFMKIMKRLKDFFFKSFH